MSYAGWAEARLPKAQDCASPSQLLNQRPFGIDRLQQTFRADSESCLMELFLFHFRRWGNTLEQVFLGVQAFGTIEPRNLEAILSIHFQDWSVGSRHKVMFPLLGDGIFTQDGAAWNQSRDPLRPQFLHRQYETLEIFRQPVEDFLQVMPTRGVIELQPLLFRLTLDVTAALLFGESVNSLTTTALDDRIDFLEAFNIAQDYVAKRIRFQNLYWLIGRRPFRDVCNTVHRFANNIIDSGLFRDKSDDRFQYKHAFLDTLGQNYADRTTLRSQIINPTSCWTRYDSLSYLVEHLSTSSTSKGSEKVKGRG